MNHPMRNYIAYTLASFIVFFDVLISARTIFTQKTPNIIYVLNIGLLVFLFIIWRANKFPQSSIKYGLTSTILTITLYLLQTQNEIFWLIIITNLVILVGLTLLATIWAPKKPLNIPLDFSQPTPRIEQNIAKKIREKIEINSKDRTILLYGEPSKHKQFDVVLKAFPTLQSLFPDEKIYLLITTWDKDSKYVKKLKKIATSLDIIQNVKFIKTTDPENLKYIINLAEIIIFPYHITYDDPSDLNTVLPYLKGIVTPNTPLFTQLVNGKTCIKINNIKNKEILAIAIERLLKDEELLLQLGYNLSQQK